MSKPSIGIVCVKTQCVPLLIANLDRIAVLFSAELTKNEKHDTSDYSSYDVTAPISQDRIDCLDFINRVQVRS